MKTSNVQALNVLYLEPDAKYSALVQGSLSDTIPSELSLDISHDIDEAIHKSTLLLFDAILMDPVGLDGDVFLNCLEMCQTAAQVPVVVLTTNDDGSFADRLLAAGIQDFLIKGQADGHAIIKAIRFAIERRRQPSLSVAITKPSINQTVRILSLEDNPLDAMVIQKNLIRFLGDQCEVVNVGYLCDAFEQLASGSFSAAILDLSLPDSRGLETCTSLLKRAPGLPLVVYTGSDDAVVPIMALRHGACDFLVKQRTTGQELARSVRFAIKRQSSHARPVPETVTVQSSVASSISDRPSRALRLESAAIGRDAAGNRIGFVDGRRTDERYQIVRPVLVIPVLPGGHPDWENRVIGVSSELGNEGISLELEARDLNSREYIVGIERHDGVLCYAGIIVRQSEVVSARRMLVDGEFGGRGQELLSSFVLTPSFDPETKRLQHTVPKVVLGEWSEIKVLKPVLLDRVQVCPQCEGLPTFRPGCHSCGSGRLNTERLIHHFACARVGPISEFEHEGELVCPKCRSRGLVIGSDFEYQNGQIICEDCHWTSSQAELVGQCLGCGFRFPGSQATLVELIGYHVQRLDTLAFISSPR